MTTKNFDPVKWYKTPTINSIFTFRIKPQNVNMPFENCSVCNHPIFDESDAWLIGWDEDSCNWQHKECYDSANGKCLYTNSLFPPRCFDNFLLFYVQMREWKWMTMNARQKVTFLMYRTVSSLKEHRDKSQNW